MTRNLGMSADGSVEEEKNAVLKVEGVKKYYKQNTGFYNKIMGNTKQVKAVDDVDLAIQQGEIVAIVGESGCGKTTLGRTILNLEEPTDGNIYYKNEEISDLSSREMKPYRRKLQIIFQNPLNSLNPQKSVGQILKAPMEVHDIGENDTERDERARELLTRVGLKSRYMDRRPHEFSGGQQQRIAIARSLSIEPDLLIADEPTSSLDVSVQSRILTLLDDLQEDYGLSVLFISHDLSTVRYIADRVNVMYLGEIIESAPTESLFDNPQHPYTKSLLSSVPRIDPSNRSNRIVLEGTVPSPLDPPSGCRFHTRCPEVIPPDDWTGSQAAFKSVFDYRNRVLANEIDPNGIRTRLETTDQNVTDEEVIEFIVQTVKEDVDGKIPEKATDIIRESANAFISGESERAAKLVREAFNSPCAYDSPVSTKISDEHFAACHRIE